MNKIKYTIFLVSMILMSSCASPRTAPAIKNPDLDKYLQTIEGYFQADYPGSLVFAETLEGDTVGLCEVFYSVNLTIKVITISKEYFDQVQESQRWALLLHEYGHCTFDLAHNDSRLGDSCPASIMNPTVIPAKCYNKHKEYYWEQLYNESRNR